MIGIQLDSGFLTLKSNASIRIEKNFDILEQQFSLGDYSFPFDIPADENNLSKLGFITEVANPNKKTTYNCYIYLFDMPWQKATLIVLGNNKKDIKINLAAGLKALNTGTKSLKALDWGDDLYLGKFPVDIALTCTNIANEATYQLHGYTFVPHINTKFYNNDNPDFLGVLNMVDPSTGMMYHNTTTNKYALVPWLYLHFILQKIFDSEGLTPNGTFWSNPEMQKLLVYNNFSLDSLNGIGDTQVKTINYQEYFQSDFTLLLPGALPYFKTCEFIKGPADTYDEPFAFNNATHEYEITAAGLITMEFNGHIFMQFGNLLYFGFSIDNHWVGGQNSVGLSQGEHFYSFTTTFTATLAHIGKKLKIGFAYYFLLPTPTTTNRWCYITADSQVKISISNENNNNFFSRYMNLRNHVKDITVEEFLLAVKKLGINIDFDYNKKTVTLDFISTVINEKPSLNFTDKAVNDFEVSYDRYKKGYTVSYDFGDKDQLNTDNFLAMDPTTIGGEVNTISELPVINSAGTIFYIKNLNQFYISSYDVYAAVPYFWKHYSDYYYENKFENGENEVKLTFAPMLMGMGKNIPVSPNANLEVALMPASKCPGSSPMYNVGENDFDLRLCFFRGQNVMRAAPYNKGGKYLFASTTTLGLNANIVGDYDFTFHLESGFWKRFLYDLYVRISSGELYEQDFRLTELDVLLIKEAVKINVDGSVFITSSISLVIDQFIKTARFKMLKI